jgi:hypothetical protein
MLALKTKREKFVHRGGEKFSEKNPHYSADLEHGILPQQKPCQGYWKSEYVQTLRGIDRMVKSLVPGVT